MPLFELHIPILNDIKEKGLVPTIKATSDDVVERITAGLRIADIRSVLRDDPPGREWMCHGRSIQPLAFLAPVPCVACS